LLLETQFRPKINFAIFKGCVGYSPREYMNDFLFYVFRNHYLFCIVEETIAKDMKSFHMHETLSQTCLK
jgi:hypothetical protein